MSKEKNKSIQLYTSFIGLELILYWLNKDNLFQISGFAYPLIIATVIGLCVFLFKVRNHDCKVTFTNFTCFILLIWITVLGFSDLDMLERGYYLTYILMLLNLMFLESLKISRTQVEKMAYAYIAGAFIISIFIIVIQKRYYAMDITRLTIKVGSNDIIDPNYLGTFLCAPVFLCIYFLEKASKRMWRIILLFTSILILIGLILTGSRGAMLAVFTGFVTMFFPKTREKLHLKKIVVMILGVIIAFLIIYNTVPLETLDRFLEVNTWQSDGSNSRRLALWGNAIEAIKKYPVFGTGVGNTALSIGKITGIYEPSHNTYLELWIQTGVFGLIMILVIFIRTFFSCKNRLGQAIIISTLVFSIFISAEATIAFWSNISIVILLSKIEEEHEQPLNYG